MLMTRISKNIAFTVPPTMAEEFEQLAREEQSTKSEMFRRIFRFYQSSRKSSKKQKPDFETDFDAWVETVIFDAVEEKKNNPMGDEELYELDDKLLSYGAERAKALGITSEEQINDIIHEERQKRRQAARRP
ncbi:MAG: ribbon-helix-helix domain-containing protein [Methylovulum sp.]|nr:ribbon-helix-helix domain-containing protein [Methylovulum sp.]